MRLVKSFPLLLLLLLPVVAGCGGGDSDDNKNVSLSISPAKADVVAGKSILLTVRAENTEIVWPSTGTIGTVSPNKNTTTAVYTPHSNVGKTYEFKVTAKANSNITATSTITVVDPSGAISPTPGGKVFDIGDKPVQKHPTASPRVILVEFTDYQCPDCSRYFTNIFPQIKAQYIDTGKISYAVLDYPLESHEHAEKAAQASHCAEDQGKFWEMHDAMLTDQDAVEDDDLSSYASDLGLDVSAFEKCLKDEKYAAEVTEDMVLGEELGLTGTPYFVVGVKETEDSRDIKMLTSVDVANSIEDFKRKLDPAINAYQ